ncbi:TIGR02269 family lipoprotein [Myxococcus faecalis]|uniref:SitA6 family polymorphic toxin lipoprotein n=1 Tax=Myxococcus faecalis TaxID=3115646 RepID=UPI003D4480EF
MHRSLRYVGGLLGLLLMACASSPESSSGSQRHLAHIEGEDCGETDRCVTLVCDAGAHCGLYSCEDAGRLLARGGGPIAPPSAPGSGPRRHWGNVQKLPGGNGPIFVFDWYNTPQPQHRPPELPSGPGWVRHHLFPQAESLARWFTRAPRGLNVHDFTMVVPANIHQRIHSGPRGGDWNREWSDFARQYPGASHAQVWEHLGKLIQKYDLVGPIVPYYYLR